MHYLKKCRLIKVRKRKIKKKKKKKRERPKSNISSSKKIVISIKKVIENTTSNRVE